MTFIHINHNILLLVRGEKPLFLFLPPSPSRGFAKKGLNPYQPERSEGSGGSGDYVCTAIPTHRFFVTSFLRMTFEAIRLPGEGR